MDPGVCFNFLEVDTPQAPTIGPKRFDVLVCTPRFGRMQNGGPPAPSLHSTRTPVLERSPPHIELLCSHSDPILIPEPAISSLVDVACVRTLIQRAGRYHLNPQRAKFLSPPPTSRQSLQLRSLRLRFSREAVSSSANHTLPLPFEKWCTSIPTTSSEMNMSSSFWQKRNRNPPSVVRCNPAPNPREFSPQAFAIDL